MTEAETLTDRHRRAGRIALVAGLDVDERDRAIEEVRDRGYALLHLAFKRLCADLRAAGLEGEAQQEVASWMIGTATNILLAVARVDGATETEARAELQRRFRAYGDWIADAGDE